METSTALDPSQVLELRQYTLHPGKRDTLIELFDRCFVESQEELGMRVLGQFRDMDAPDRFVWMRGFADLPSRTAPLEAFYGGPVWKQHRDAANATMIDSDNVLLLRPVDAGAGFLLPRTRLTAVPESGAFVLATIYLLRSAVDDAFVRWFDARISPVMAAAGAPPLARFRTEYGVNEFPRLPVREGEHAFVWFSSFASGSHHERHRAELARAASWTRHLEPELVARCASPPQQLRLAPTARSLLRHAEPFGYTTHRKGAVHDFDFLPGDWHVVNRRLKVRNAGCTEWDEFPATSRARLHLGGIANVDELTIQAESGPSVARRDAPEVRLVGPAQRGTDGTQWPGAGPGTGTAPGGCAGMTVRYFRLADQQWTIRWISARTGDLDPGVVGGFQGDRGEFYGEDLDDGRPVKVRFIWSRLGPDAARWEQSFSYDDGPWELNWVMEFTRAP